MHLLDLGTTDEATLETADDPQTLQLHVEPIRGEVNSLCLIASSERAQSFACGSMHALREAYLVAA